MNNIPKTFDDYRFAAVSSIVPIVHLDIALRKLGASQRRPPVLHAGSVPDRLSWGVDSAVSAARLLFAGQIIGAATVIRNQLELWMSQRANRYNLDRQEGESTVAFAARVWNHKDDLYDQWHENRLFLATNIFEEDDDWIASSKFPGWLTAMTSAQSGIVPDHLHVYRSDGTDVCPPLLYGGLSEYLHLRAAPFAAIWDAELLAASNPLREDVVFAASLVCDAIFLVLREIRMSAISLAKSRGIASAEGLLLEGLDSVSTRPSRGDRIYEPIPFGATRSFETRVPPISALAPLLPREGLNSAMVGAVDALSRDFDGVLRGRRPAGRLYEDDELLVRAFAWHRRRSIDFARSSLLRERQALGVDFDEDSLAARATRWIVLTEGLGLLALWHKGEGVQAAAAALGSSLRSAYWLWLEDDDRAMAVLRNCLEYAAQLRTWRNKPMKAARLAGSMRTTPRDWLTQAGWKQLSLLNQILGEFAHAHRMKQWPTARRMLSELQLRVDPEKAIFTARGAAVDFVASLAAREAVLLLAEVSVEISKSIGRLLAKGGFDLDEQSIDVRAQFAHIWSARSRLVG